MVKVKKKKKIDEEALRLAREQELERLRIEAENKAKRAKERRELAAKIEKERWEQGVRDEVLRLGCEAFQGMAREQRRRDLLRRERHQWHRYVKCDGLPLPENVQMMNTFLFLWQNRQLNNLTKHVIPKISETLGLLAVLEEYLEDPLDASEELIMNWTEVRDNYRKTLQLKIDLATFHILRDLNRMNRLDFYTVDYTAESREMALGLWTWLRVPVSQLDNRAAPSVDFPNVGMSVELPKPFQDQIVVLRLMRLKYNHYNDRCRSYSPPPVPEELRQSLYDVTLEQFNEKEALRREIAQQVLADTPVEERPPLVVKDEYSRDVTKSVAFEQLSLGESEVDMEQKEEKVQGQMEGEEAVEEEEKMRLTSVEGGGSTTSLDRYIKEQEEEEVEESPTNLVYTELESIVDVGELVLPKFEESYMRESQEELSTETKAKEILKPTADFRKLSLLIVKPSPKVWEEEANKTAKKKVEVSLTRKLEKDKRRKMTAALNILDDDYSVDENPFLAPCKLEQSVETDATEAEQEFLWQEFYAIKERRKKPNLALREKLLPRDIRKLIKDTKLPQPKIVDELTAARKKKRIENFFKTVPTGPGSDKQHAEIYRTPSEILQDNEDDSWQNCTAAMTLKTDPGELNMRSHNVVGGIYSVDLFEQPSQEVVQQDRSKVTVLHGDLGLLRKPFHFVYVPPTITADDEEGKEDEAEGERKKQQQEDEIDLLIKVSITLPDDVLWFDPPKPVQWSEDLQYWADHDVYDSKFNEDKQMLSFRIGKIAPLGLSVYRFSNLPFQTWELRPDIQDPSCIFFTITCNTVIVEFLIKADEVCLYQLQNATGSALEYMIGSWFSPRELIRKMRRGNIDIFPEMESYIYIEGGAPKYPPCELHLYHCMALVAHAYAFTWSRWNLLAGRRSMVLQMKELSSASGQPQTNYSTLLVKPDRAVLVDCTEVSPSFTEQGIEGMMFYPDLLSIITDRGSDKTKEKLETTTVALTKTLYFMLMNTKVLSYS